MTGPDTERRSGMFTRIDHVMICVPDLQQGIETYARLGFNIYPGGVHHGAGTHNAIAFHHEDYLELLNAPSLSSCIRACTPALSVGPPPGTAADWTASSSSRFEAPCWMARRM